MKRSLGVGLWSLVFGLWSLGVLLSSCEEKVEKPTLSDEKLSHLMADLFTAEAATNGLSGYLKDSLLQIYFKQVLEMNGVTKEEYEKNLRLIANDLPRMEGIVKKAEELLDTGKKSDTTEEKK